MDLLNPANPINMINPASPWYHVWNSNESTYKAAETAVDVTLTIADKIAFGAIGVGIVAVVCVFAWMLWNIVRG